MISAQQIPSDITQGAEDEAAVKLIDDVLASVGLGALNPGSRADLIRAFNNEFEIRVGQSILDRLTSEEVEEIEELIDAEDVAGADHWFELHRIDRRYLAKRHYEVLVHELKTNAEHILAALGTTNERQEEQ